PVRQGPVLPAYPSKIVYQSLKEFPAYTPVLAWVFDTLNCCYRAAPPKKPLLSPDKIPGGDGIANRQGGIAGNGSRIA
ncbi:MAG: hypothetical protein LBB98_09665, partial [Treponema sp.]|nr:hypothetical protein [Treponema sp.]